MKGNSKHRLPAVPGAGYLEQARSLLQGLSHETDNTPQSIQNTAPVESTAEAKKANDRKMARTKLDREKNRKLRVREKKSQTDDTHASSI